MSGIVSNVAFNFRLALVSPGLTGNEFYRFYEIGSIRFVTLPSVHALAQSSERYLLKQS